MDCVKPLRAIKIRPHGGDKDNRYHQGHLSCCTREGRVSGYQPHLGTSLAGQPPKRLM